MRTIKGEFRYKTDALQFIISLLVLFLFYSRSLAHDFSLSVFKNQFTSECLLSTPTISTTTTVAFTMEIRTENKDYTHNGDKNGYNNGISFFLQYTHCNRNKAIENWKIKRKNSISFSITNGFFSFSHWTLSRSSPQKWFSCNTTGMMSIFYFTLDTGCIFSVWFNSFDLKFKRKM